ncbi:MAG: flagellar protein FlaG [Ethanoligenens sp.]|uniref:flagellar protein FlaG n=1 Tax=Ethanoligenens sp. TaxID=2099655 RepID=UPI0039EC7EA7
MQIDNIHSLQVTDVPQPPVVAGTPAVNTEIYGQKKSNTDDNGTEGQNNAGRRATKRVEEQLDHLNRAAQQNQRHIQYTILEQPHTVILQIVDTETGKVLDEIPSEKMVKLVDAMQTAAGGRLDRKI